MRLLCTSLLAASFLAGCGSWGGHSTQRDAGASAGSVAMATPTRTADGVLIGPTGKTLYTFDRDSAGSGRSACNDACAANWPPLMAPATAQPIGNYSVVTRNDGTRQWAYKGWPLYYWAKDMQAGDRTGDGVGGVWKVARP